MSASQPTSIPADARLGGSLDGKVALVTGGSRGIGRAIAQRLGADGALVAVHYGSRADAAAEVVDAIERSGGAAFAVGQRLGGDGDAAALFEHLDAALRERIGETRVDVLVNNAAISLDGGLAETTADVLDEIHAVNVRAPLLITREAISRMPDGSRVITITSSVCRHIEPTFLAYSMGKAALEMMTKVVAKELAPRQITVNAVSPGIVDTEMNGDLMTTPEGREMAASVAVLGRVGEPQDIAGVVAFVASDDASWMTGEVLDVSGGSAL